ncbi:hypothetical protein GQ457_07G040390 [Hibiscus cannabinus]
MLKIWRWYERCLSLHPVKTQVISSGVLWAIGDVGAQYITYSTAKKRLQCKVSTFAIPIPSKPCVCSCNPQSWFWFGIITFLLFYMFLFDLIECYWLFHNCRPPLWQEAELECKIDWKRAAATSMFGFGFVGPVGHYWEEGEEKTKLLLELCNNESKSSQIYIFYVLHCLRHLFCSFRYEGLDRFIKSRFQLRPKTASFVAAKVAMDGILFSPVDLLLFFSYMGLSTGKSVPQVKEDVKRDFLPALILEGGIWPIVQIANFRYIPVRYQLLYVNIFCLLDCALLSWIEQQNDAPWKWRFGGGQGRW